MRRLPPLLLAMGFTSVLAAAPAEPLRFASPDLHYSFTAPAGWVAMPPEVLKTRGGSAAVGAPAPVAGFQAPAESWFHVPAMVVTHLPDRGRRPRDIFEELGHDSGLGASKSLIYGQKDGMVLLRERMPSSDGGQIQRVAIFKPGTLGVVHLDFYLPYDPSPLATPELDPDLRQVVDSLRFEEGFGMRDLAPGETGPLLEYVRNFYRTRPQARLMLILGFVLLIFSIFNARRKNRQKREGP